MSDSYDKFLQNLREIDDLDAMHVDITGGSVGRPTEKVAVLNKAGFVLVCAFWQSYCEEVLFEILASYKDGKAKDVPTALQVALGHRSIKDGKASPTSFWKFAAKGWKNELEQLVAHLQEDTARPLDSPSSENVEKIFLKYLGLRKISDNWYWPGMSVEQACRKLDDAIKRRHRLAHRGADTKPIHKIHVTDFANHVKRLAEKTDAALKAGGFV